eukprot:TRINITY_DN5618_c0_g1_i1.p1 TRINITY_DN5618_c0_g1~~TRINITY_DN5618_c0_g1_i1.p1  ORF type:complete len:238 (+),score=47.79 TRINITY_DN5618_c0_g1_i1:140-853(+)
MKPAWSFALIFGCFWLFLSLSFTNAQSENDVEDEESSNTTDANTQFILDLMDEIADAVQKYVPRFYFSENERYFPSAVEDIVDWSSISWDDVLDESYTLEFKPPAGTQPFSASAPVYANVRYYGDDEIWITYTHTYNYNDCGPAARVTGSAVGVKVKKSISVCPIGIHNGDSEHVTIALTSGLSDITGIYFSRHSGGKWVKSTDAEWDDLSWDGDHVKVFQEKAPMPISTRQASKPT